MAAELEADIERSPDDPAGYLVYGDYLAGKGDPRGELIALQAAVQRAPGDKRLAKALHDHLEAHRNELLGPIANREGVTFVWQLGFVRDVRISLQPADTLRVLDQLIAHPVGRFLQSITIAGPTAPGEVVAHLLATGRPKTLADLRIGDWEPDAAMRAAFPRLNRSIDVVWRAIADALAKHKRLDVKYDASTLPPLVPLPGVPRPPLEVTQLLLGLRVQCEKLDIGLPAAMRRTFTAESLDQFAAALGAQFVELGEPTALRWGFAALGKLGGDLTAAFIAAHLRSWSHQRAVQAAAVLAEIGTGLAIWELYAMTADPTFLRPRRTDATRILREVARDQKLALDRLLDRTLPIGLASPTLEHMRATASRRLLLHMIEGRRIGDRDFMRYFVEHPVVAPLVERLVWACYEHETVECTFRIAGGKAVDPSGKPIELGGASIGVLHPAELPADERDEVLAAWKPAKLAPPFPQLERPVFALREQETGSELTRFKLRQVGFDHLRNVLERERDWHVSDQHDQGGTAAWGRVFARGGIDAEAQVASGGGAIERVTVRRGGKPVDLQTVHPVTISELLYDLDAATTRSRANPSLESAAGLTGEITKGTRVSMFHGRTGTVFWIGDRGEGVRVGVRGDDGVTTWADIDEVVAIASTGSAGARSTPAGSAESIDVPAPAAPKPAKPAGPELAKGTRVAWKKGHHTGTGTVFWTGPNKFGDGMRAGIKDDETGETVWADAADCKPEA